ncbi:MAG TPA: DUF4870 domain-containing protein [Pyrinomonadaceae bacterium]|jgi:hypothetical protein|nr:DUF4870 domain-containing protein [Pyrinomonadaceae bacterium]
MSFGLQYQEQAYLQTPEQKQMGMWLHLSQLAGLIVPAAGLIIPIVLWQTQKEKMPALDAHGKMVTNWIISAIIYAVVSVILIFVFFIGLIPLLGLSIASIVFPIIGAVKANNGELWEYPLTIKFLK